MGMTPGILTPDMLEEIKRKMAQPTVVPNPQMQGPMPNPPPATNESIMYPQMQQPQVGAPAPSTQYSPEMQASLGEPANPAAYAQERDATPAYSELQRFRADNQRPMQGDYHPSMKRKIGAAILGGFAGLGGAKQGVETADSFLNSPYRSKLSDYEAKLSDKEKAFKEESEATKSKADAGDKEAQRVQRIALGKESEAKAALDKFKMSPEGRRQQRVAAMKGPYNLTLKNGENLIGMMDPESGNFYNPATKMSIGTDAVEKYELHTASEPKTSEMQAVDQWKKEHGGKEPSYAERVQIRHDWAETGQTDERAKYLEGLGGVNTARTDEAKNKLAGNKAEVVKSDTEAVRKNPQYLYNLDETQRGLVKTEMIAQHIPVPRKLAPGLIERRFTAQRSVTAAEDVEKLLKDPDVINNIGFWAGNYDEKTRKFIGDNPGKTPQEKQKAQMYRTALEQLFAQEVQAITKGAARPQILKQMSELGGKPQDALDIIKGVIAQAKTFGKGVIGDVHKEEYGNDETDDSKVNNMIEEYIKSKRSVQR